MSNTPHDLYEDFPEKTAKIHELKASDAHFARMVDEYHEVNRAVHRAETLIEAQALRVPVSAVFPLPAAAGASGHGVFVFEGGRARLRPVTVKVRAGPPWPAREGAISQP